jgi:membrane-associated protease RseP (regulator of RpoE activity)
VLIAAAVALATLRGNSDNIGRIDDVPDGGDLTELRDNTYAATGHYLKFSILLVLYSSIIGLFFYSFFAGVAIAVACFGIIYEVLFIVLRFLNIGLLNLKSKILLVVVSSPTMSHLETSL